MITYRFATLDDIDLLVSIRINDLTLFSKKEILPETIASIRDFYVTNLSNDTGMTLLGYQDDNLVASGTLFFYRIIPSNDNPKGMMGQLTNIYVDPNYRHQGIATHIINTLISKGQAVTNFFCLNASKEALPLYEKLGFKQKDNYMIYYHEI